MDDRHIPFGAFTGHFQRRHRPKLHRDTHLICAKRSPDSTFSFADIDTFSTASLVNRCTMDVRQIQDAVMQIIRMLVRAPTLLIVSMVICIRLHAGLSIVYWLAIPALLATLFVIMRITKPFFSAMRTRSDALNACVQENMIAIRVVKTFVRSNYEKEKFRRANDALTDTSISASIRIALMHPCSHFQSCHHCFVLVRRPSRGQRCALSERCCLMLPI
ncbi:ABC transporter transmembrane domain-containing protein [Ruthenibacterium lactatiformans]|uniref:ABC transporter transmembrane domain-containing protein n=1 Tax=Ruthenibacterium lactatiformans TaxID=1550024 RepID=UPI0039A33537